MLNAHVPVAGGSTLRASQIWAGSNGSPSLNRLSRSFHVLAMQQSEDFLRQHGFTKKQHEGQCASNLSILWHSGQMTRQARGRSSTLRTQPLQQVQRMHHTRLTPLTPLSPLTRLTRLTHLIRHTTHTQRTQLHTQHIQRTQRTRRTRHNMGTLPTRIHILAMEARICCILLISTTFQCQRAL
ncbi:unnamed protein product [Symbiodinium natans]|uniref:Uncharacterized protein n=1 Tax=Symbiodinium natans TaxID=878477 RepID=A0A812J4V1_9DINO|nr:unnamed protein product [Symbiodinium natans]